MRASSSPGEPFETAGLKRSAAGPGSRRGSAVHSSSPQGEVAFVNEKQRMEANEPGAISAPPPYKPLKSRTPTEGPLDLFLREQSRRLQENYARIERNRRTDKRGRSQLADPGSAGDQGELNGAQVLRDTLPQQYLVRTKGNLFFADGSMSPQTDVVVLSPWYPPGFLKDESIEWLASGTMVVLECKLTLKRHHIAEAAEKAARISRGRGGRRDTPRSCLHGPIVHGLVAHESDLRPDQIRELILRELGKREPRESIDVVCVATKGCWHRLNTIEPEFDFGDEVGPNVVHGDYREYTHSAQGETANFPVSRRTPSRPSPRPSVRMTLYVQY